jgi:hypothetical protein
VNVQRNYGTYGTNGIDGIDEKYPLDSVVSVYSASFSTAVQPVERAPHLALDPLNQCIFAFDVPVGINLNEHLFVPLS